MQISRRHLLTTATALLFSTATKPLYSTTLSLGADYLLRQVSIKERDKTIPKDSYVDQRIEGYLTTDLSKDVEASVRVQSITPWGLEGSSTPLVTRYPNSNGNVWLQNAFVRLPNLWRDRIVLTLGRQPIVWGDGAILSDDDLGFNAVRAQIKSPFRFLPVDLDAFSAKIREDLRGPGDIDLIGAQLGFDRGIFRWQIMDLTEISHASDNYEAGADTAPFLASKVKRQIYGVRAKATLRDAFLRGEYYVQRGQVQPASVAGQDIQLGGDGYIVGLGGKSNNTKYGRFGAILEVAGGSGDDPSTKGKDEAFRPTFASRWSGLERRGFGRYYAATLSDAYSPNAPFSPATSTNTGLPDGTSGIQIIHFGLDATPFAQWTLMFDYDQYKAQQSIGASKDLGTELDYAIEYRYSGLVTFRGSFNEFSPGQAYNNDLTPKQKARYTSVEADVHF